MDLTAYIDLLAPLYDRDVAWMWLQMPQPTLDGAVPVDLIRAGQQQRVLDVIHQLRDSVHV